MSSKIGRKIRDARVEKVGHRSRRDIREAGRGGHVRERAIEDRDGNIRYRFVENETDRNRREW